MTIGVRITSGGVTYNLANNPRYQVEAVDGLGFDVPRLSQSGPGQLGDTDLGFAQRPRSIIIRMAANACDVADDLFDLRETVATIFRPRARDAAVCEFTMPNGNVRNADCFTEGLFGFRQSDRIGPAQRITISLKASDPRLYDPTPRSLEFNLLASSTGGLPIPFTIPIPIGRSTLAGSQTIAYAGLSRLASIEFPIITISGPITSPVILNATTGEKIDLTGLEVATGDQVIIDLSGKPRRDSKTIRDQDGNSVAQFLSNDSDLATFHLSYAGELLDNGSYSDGNNVITVSGSDANSLTSVLINWFDRYEGA